MTPITVEVTRGDRVESRHLVSAVVVEGDRPVAAWGEAEMIVFPRSSLKPLQALALLENGVALDDRRLALACASHNGEPEHLDGVLAWLAEQGLGPADLECGAHPPIDTEAAEALVLARRRPGPEHNNCSGKHCGFLALARALGAGTRGYVGHGHPVQAAIRRSAGEALGVDLDRAPWGVDGCGVPNYGVPLPALARGFAGLVGGRVFAAMTAHPYLVAGRNRFDTAIMRAAPGAVAVKGGAEGVLAACLPGSRLGVALKVHDGAKRAADVAMAAILARLGETCAEPLATAPVTNAAGLTVGEIRVRME